LQGQVPPVGTPLSSLVGSVHVLHYVIEFPEKQDAHDG